jgi:exopolysaccharide biosynthesis polyprenyl glycosylphosphotransferase
LPAFQTPVASNIVAAQRLARSSATRKQRGDRSSVRTSRPRRHVLREDLFKDVLVRERKRSDRSNQPFILVLVTGPDSRSAEAPRSWESVVAAVTAAKRETDVVGWFTQRSVLGVMLPEIGEPLAMAPELEAHLRQELSMLLDPVAASAFSIRLYAHTPSRVGEAPCFQPIDPLLGPTGPHQRPSTTYDALKRALDFVGSLARLIVLSPLFLLIAALVRLQSSGPVFFRQARIGLHAKPFTMLKFRTMYVNADDVVHQQYVSWFIKSSSQTSHTGKDTLFKIANDPRVTAVGRILRKTSFDELPQLWNVLRGDMSLVGPRPPLRYEVDQYEPWHCRRVLEVKPGITGLWQVSGRSRTTFDEMVRLDLRYARTCSLWNDIKILLATPRAVISGKGAC